MLQWHTFYIFIVLVVYYHLYHLLLEKIQHNYQFLQQILVNIELIVDNYQNLISV